MPISITSLAHLTNQGHLKCAALVIAGVSTEVKLLVREETSAKTVGSDGDCVLFEIVHLNSL